MLLPFDLDDTLTNDFVVLARGGLSTVDRSPVARPLSGCVSLADVSGRRQPNSVAALTPDEAQLVKRRKSATYLVCR